MKKTITITLLSAGLTLSAFSLAQPPEEGRGPHAAPPPMEKVARRMIERRDQLDLSDEQVAQLQNIAENGGERGDIHNVLTEEQRRQIHEQRQKMHHGKQHEKRQASEPPGS